MTDWQLLHRYFAVTGLGIDLSPEDVARQFCDRNFGGGINHTARCNVAPVDRASTICDRTMQMQAMHRKGASQRQQLERPSPRPVQQSAGLPPLSYQWR